MTTTDTTYHAPDCGGRPFCDGCGYVRDGRWYPGPEPTTSTEARYFVAPDGADDSCLWFGTPTDPNPRLVAVESPATTRNTMLPAPLFDLVTTVLDPTDDEIDAMAEVLWHHNGAGMDWNDLGAVNRDYYRRQVRAVLTVLAGGVLA